MTWPTLVRQILTPEVGTLRCPPSMTDDDVDFWSDLLCLRALVDEVQDTCLATAQSAWDFPAVMSLQLDAAIQLCREGFTTKEKTR